MQRPVAALTCAVTMIATVVPALADPFPPPLATAVTNLSAATSFHVVALAHGHEVNVDCVKPGKFHITGAGGHLDAIEIGGTSYVRVGSRYRKFPVPGLSDTLDPIEKLSDLATSHANDFTVKDLGTSTVDGVAVHGFAVARANSARAAKSPSTIYVAADGTIHQITQHTRFGMITLTFSKFNAPMTIEAPAN